MSEVGNKILSMLDKVIECECVDGAVCKTCALKVGIQLPEVDVLDCEGVATKVEALPTAVQGVVDVRICGNDYEKAIRCDKNTGAQVLIITAIDENGVPTTNYYDLVTGELYTGDPSTDLEACGGSDIESDPQDMCDGGVNFVRWIVKKDGVPTGVYYDTDVAGALYTPSGNETLGACSNSDDYELLYSKCMESGPDTYKVNTYVNLTDDTTKVVWINTASGLVVEPVEGAIECEAEPCAREFGDTRCFDTGAGVVTARVFFTLSDENEETYVKATVIQSTDPSYSSGDDVLTEPWLNIGGETSCNEQADIVECEEGVNPAETIEMDITSFTEDSSNGTILTIDENGILYDTQNFLNSTTISSDEVIDVSHFIDPRIEIDWEGVSTLNSNFAMNISIDSGNEFFATTAQDEDLPNSLEVSGTITDFTAPVMNISYPVGWNKDIIIKSIRIVDYGEGGSTIKKSLSVGLDECSINTLATALGTPNEVATSLVQESGKNTSIPAGLKSVTINNITGVSIIDGTYELGNGRRDNSISFGTARGNNINEVLPGYSISGGTWQWIGHR